MSKFSVKKPYIVLVSVLVLCVLSVVGFTRMTTDFLPKMNLPYMVVVTTYPGASPQKVESEITDKIEDSVATINGVKNVTSQSMANASQIMLEFENSTNMDSAMVKVTSAVNQLDFPDTVSNPMIMEVSMDMMPIVYVSASKKGLKDNDLTEYLNEEIIPELKRQEGVGSVQGAGLVEKSIEVKLKQSKIDAVNERIRASVVSDLDEARAELDKAQSELNSAKSKLNKQEKKLQKQQKKTGDQMGAATQSMNTALAAKQVNSAQLQTIQASLATLQAQKKQLEETKAGLEAMGAADQAAAVDEQITQVDSQISGMNTQIAALNKVDTQLDTALKNYTKVESGKISAATAFATANAQIASAKTQITDGQNQIKTSLEQYEESREAALKNANANKLLSFNTLSGIITAQNFSMPVGYISDDESQYLLRIDEEANTMDDVEDLVLMHMDGVGDIRIMDVADVNYVDNGDETYAKVNGEDAAVLAIYKTSSAGTAAVSDVVNEKMNDLAEAEEGLEFVNLMDQGEYIDLIINSVFSNLILGAILAFLVLLLFLRDIRPTLVVALSIPLSVMFALLLMFFSDISLNIISLSGLALGIGMLVDNSIVVMENIYRLRAQGVPAAKAAVQGASQVAAAIAASTLTTICVFVPILFTDGLTRELMMDMCLTITFSLLASLMVALTVVPSLSATLMRNAQAKEHPWFERMLNKYEGALRWCLKHKALPLLVAAGLLVLCGVRVVNTGIVMIPEMGSTQLSMTMTGNEDTDVTEDYEVLDKVYKQVKKIEGVETVGIIQATTIMSGMGGNDKSYSAMVLLNEDYANQNKEVSNKIEKVLSKQNFEDYSVSAQTMDTSATLGSGLSISIYGNDETRLLDISQDLMEIVDKTEGFTNTDNGQDAATKEIVLNINKTAAMKRGLTIAQIYQALLEKVTTEQNATSITVDDQTIQVNLKDSRKPLTKDNLLDYKIEYESTDAQGNTSTKKVRLGKIATFKERDSVSSIGHENGSKIMTVTAETEEGYNTTLLSRDLEKELDKYDTPAGYKIEIGGEYEQVNTLVKDILLMMLVAFILIYLIMVAQFANFFLPFIVMFTIPLAFTGGFLALMITGAELSMISMMGFLILSGVVVNNGIVFIDYANQMRISGLDKTEALVKTGRDRMRPILMTALTTILAMSAMALSQGQGAEMSRGMAIVTIGGLAYATLMTLFIVPILYSAFSRKAIKVVDLGDEPEGDVILDAGTAESPQAPEMSEPVEAAEKSAPVETPETPQTERYSFFDAVEEPEASEEEFDTDGTTEDTTGAEENAKEGDAEDGRES